ncbi:TOMM precursor leader peptide-binding protein [Streptomyces sp. NPDC005963]|uniref:TOMM precursor leader peptide-binding protein n=1 Tax=Streptomyces sp. NPDC005963 TaxID=3156721 RepID=UPI0033F29670
MNRQLLLLASGAFGKDVAQRFESGSEAYPHHVTVVEIDNGTHPSLWPRADLIVVATAQERPRINEATDRAAFAWGTPWFGVHTTSTEVVCGPVVIPGRTACHQCYERRRDQHKRTEHSTADPGDRHPTGYPVHHVGVAAAFARQAVDEALRPPEDEEAIGATVRKFDQISGATSRTTVTAVNRCTRCRTAATSTDLWSRLAAIDEGRTV